MALPAIKAHDHKVQQEILAVVLDDLRRRLAIPTTYRIDLRVVCPRQMPEAYAATSWSYLPSRAYTIRIHCNLDEDEAQWALAHELLEIITGDLAHFTNEELNRHRAQALRNYLDIRHRELRDEMIEWLCHIILKHPRPLMAD